MPKLTVKELKHTYQDGSRNNVVLKGINATFESGKFYAILGESGSGKTTLLSLLAGLDKIQEGDIEYEGKSLEKIGYGTFRLKYVNVIFQAYNLINYMTARENVEVAMNIAGIKIENQKQYIYDLLESIGIHKEMADRPVLKLSGGEQQRVAIARALSQDVPMIMADEPTGNLDEENEDKIIEIFKDLAKKGKCVIVVTHSKIISDQADQVYKMRKGLIEKM